MRIVRFDSQERVDLPDLTAMSFLVLGEFRRMVRGLILGEDANYVIQGFAATPAGVPDATVTVTLDPGSNPLGFAIGGENLTTRIDYGQMIGGDDSAGNLEGNATQVFNFTGQPVATYRLQMRFVYQDGANDNRAFWDEGANSEFIQATDTRFLPVFELGIAVSPTSLGADYIPIADVVWNGATVSSGDITDVRPFALEGSSPFEATSMAAYTAVPDFDRSDTRGSVGLNEIYPALRAVMRQLASIKGPDDDGNFSWYSRPFRGADDTLTSPATRTKNLQSVDTVTFTVGDGVQSFGDFNGATGLEQALDAAVAHSDTLEHCKIVIKGLGDDTTTFTVANSYTFPQTIEIVADTANNAGARGRADIELTVAADSTWLTGDRVILRNLDINAANSITMVNGDGSANVIDIENCRFTSTTYDADSVADGNYAIKVNNGIIGAVLRRCEFNEVALQFHHVSGNGGVNIVLEDGMLIEQCEFDETHIALNNVVESAGIDRCLDGITFSQCKFREPGFNTYYTSAPGMLDGRGCENVHFIMCVFDLTNRDIDAVHTGDINNLHPAANWYFDKCQFEIGTGGSHAVDSGQNGAKGTGWAIFCDGDTTDPPAFDSQASRRIYIQNCTVLGDNGTGNDAGAFYLFNVVDFHIQNNFIYGFGASSGERVVGIDVDSPGNAATRLTGHISHNTIGKWENDTGGTHIGIRYRNGLGARICNNILNGEDQNETSVSMSASSQAILVTDTNDVIISGNDIFAWDSGSNCGINVDGSFSMVISDNTIVNCSDMNIFVGGASQNINIHGNVIRDNIGNSTGLELAGTVDHCAVNNNIIHFQAGGVRAGFTVASGQHIASGNRLRSATFSVGGASVWGANFTVTDMNYVT